MKARWYLFPLAVLILLVFSPVSTRSQTVVTFDDINLDLTPGYVTNIPNGYEGLSWSNFFVVNAVLLSNKDGYLTGANYGMVSPPNVAFNGRANPAEIDSPGTDFNFLSVYLTGVWNSNLNIEVEGFRGGILVYDQTVVAAATNATPFTFDYLDIDRLYLNSFGGQVAFGPVPDYNFAMDNFTFEFVPEPSSLLLAGVGAVMLWPVLKRKRAQ
jgi:hypothetical protein